MKIFLENVSAGYSNIVLKDISTEFDEGGICGILGPNGSGKTTLLRVLSGVLPYKGSITLSIGRDFELKKVSQKELARYIAVTPQISSVYFSYTVYEAIMMGRYSHSTSIFDSLKGSSKADKKKVEQSMEMTGLSDIKDRQLSELSGGQLQRVMLARTFAQETPIIMLDEPTNHLDIKYHVELIEHLKNWTEGTTTVGDSTYPNTVISVFHDIRDAAMICDKLLLLKNGEIIKKGPAQDILTRDLLKNVFETDVVSYYENAPWNN